MRKRTALRTENFELMLEWLDPDPEAARRKYEHIRSNIIRILAGRGCYEAEDVADEAVSRVAQRVGEIVGDYVGEPAGYFVGVAHNVYREWLRRPERVEDFEFERLEAKEVAADEDAGLDCLEICLEKLPQNQSDLILSYYREEKRAKIAHRQLLAESLGIKPNTLQIRLFRIRAGLRACVDECLSR